MPVGFIRKAGIWQSTSDQNELLLSPVQDSLLGETLEQIFAGSRSLLPIPEAYEPLLQYLPHLSMLGRLKSDSLIQMPVPCVLRSEAEVLEDIDIVEDAAVQDKCELAQILANAGPLLVDIDSFTYPSVSDGRRWRYAELSMKEVRELFPRSRCLHVEKAENFDPDDFGFTMPGKWRDEKWNRNEWVVLQANQDALARQARPRGKPRKRKPRPPVVPVELTVSHVAGWVYDLRRATSDCFLRGLQAHHTRDLDACWGTLQRLLPVIEQLYGRHAYRRLQEYRKAYCELMQPVMRNPAGCIRKMYHINSEFSYWLEQETESREAKQIQRGAFVLDNRKYRKPVRSSVKDLPGDYRETRLPRCMRPKPKPEKGAADAPKNDVKAAEAPAQKEAVPA